MKANMLNIDGEKIKEIELPSCFSYGIREDIVTKVLEAKKSRQPYAPSPVGGKQHSASGKIKHLRHVWKSAYGRGISRVPRKIMTRRGSQFIWVGAEIASAVGGRRAHPPKTPAMINTKKINKNEMKVALASAISATANNERLGKRYKKLEINNVKNLPIIVEPKIVSLKTKEFFISLKKILGERLFDLALKKRSIRAGKGKIRGRKYKKNAGILIVTGKSEKIKTKVFDVKNSANVSVGDLAEGGLGRLALYTENGIKELGERIK